MTPPVFLPFLLLAGLALWRSGVWERRVIREELAGEVGHAVSPGEYQEIVRHLAQHTLDLPTQARQGSAIDHERVEVRIGRKTDNRGSWVSPVAHHGGGQRPEDMRVARQVVPTDLANSTWKVGRAN